MKLGLIGSGQTRTYSSLIISVSGLWSPNKEWFDSFYRFEQQEAAKWSYGNFDIRGLGFPARGYMGKEFQDMGQGFSMKPRVLTNFDQKNFSLLFDIASNLKLDIFENPIVR